MEILCHVHIYDRHVHDLYFLSSHFFILPSENRPLTQIKGNGFDVYNL